MVLTLKNFFNVYYLNQFHILEELQGNIQRTSKNGMQYRQIVGRQNANKHCSGNILVLGPEPKHY